MKFVQGDVRNTADLFRVIKGENIDRIIRLAAVLTSISQKNPILAFNLNIGGTINVLETARIIGI